MIKNQYTDIMDKLVQFMKETGIYSFRVVEGKVAIHIQDGNLSMITCSMITQDDVLGMRVDFGDYTIKKEE